VSVASIASREGVSYRQSIPVRVGEKKDKMVSSREKNKGLHNNFELSGTREKLRPVEALSVGKQGTELGE